jgi:hypothetical protein
MSSRSYTHAITMTGVFVLSVVGSVASIACNAQGVHPSSSAVRHELQQRQLQDTLSLQLRQDMARRNDLAPRDAVRLDQLQLQQRMQQQQLNQEQLRSELLNRDRDPARAAIDQRRYAEERAVQLQRFDSEERDLARSLPSQPLQRVQPPGALLP